MVQRGSRKQRVPRKSTPRRPNNRRRERGRKRGIGPLGRIVSRPISTIKNFPWYHLTMSYHISMDSLDDYVLTPMVIAHEIKEQTKNTDFFWRISSFSIMLTTNHSVNFRTFPMDETSYAGEFLCQWVKFPYSFIRPIRTGFVWPFDHRNEIFYSGTDDKRHILSMSLGQPVIGEELKCFGVIAFKVSWTENRDDNPGYSNSKQLDLIPVHQNYPKFTTKSIKKQKTRGIIQSIDSHQDDLDNSLSDLFKELTV